MSNQLHPILKRMGWLGTFILNAGVLLTTPWAVAVSVVLGLLAGLVGWLTDFVNRPSVHAGGLMFIGTLWTYIGLIVLADRRRPRLVKAHQDYAYALTFEGCVPNYTPADEEHALQFSLQMRNFSSGPLRVTLEKFDVIIGTRMVPQEKTTRPSSFLPRGAARVLRSPIFKMDDIKEYLDKQVKGTVEFSVTYGHPEESPVRRLRTKLEIGLELKATPPVGYGDGILEESDEPINAS